jgi:lycopene cyclase domain-containing protein
MWPEYTVAALAAPVAVVALEPVALRTGLLRRGRFWAAIALVLAFQVPVDGWLTMRSAPIVSYDDRVTSGIRVPFDIPVEDFGFGFALAALTLFLWECNGPRVSRAGPAAATAAVPRTTRRPTTRRPRGSRRTPPVHRRRRRR